MNRRYFFKGLASGLVAACSPGLFLPKIIKPVWRAPRLEQGEALDPVAAWAHSHHA